MASIHASKIRSLRRIIPACWRLLHLTPATQEGPQAATCGEQLTDVTKTSLRVDRNRRRRGRDSSYSEEDEARLSDSDNEERSQRSSPDRSSVERGGRSEDSDRYRQEDRGRHYERSESDSDDDRDARSQEVGHPASATVHHENRR